MSIYKELSYRFTFSGPNLSHKDEAGRLIDRIIAICSSQPEFLRPENIERYLHMLRDFKDFRFVDFWRGQGTETAVRDVVIDHLTWALKDWILSYINDEDHPILPSYALDVAQLVVRMAGGYSDFRNTSALPIRIEGIVDPREDERDSRLGEFLNARFKAEFTRRSRLGRVLCQLPEGASVTCRERAICGAGDQFMFVTERCYLSEGVYDYVDANCDEPYRPDIQDDFRFYGYALASTVEDDDARQPVNLRMEVPGHWIIAALPDSHDQDTRDESPLPVPFRALTATTPKPFRVM